MFRIIGIIWRNILTASVRRRAGSAGIFWRWLAITAVGMLDVGWARATETPASIGTPELIECGIVGVLVLATFGFRWFHYRMAADFTRTFAQIAAFGPVANTLSCLALTTNMPMIDPALAQMDRALGLDWIGWWSLLEHHPRFHEVLQWVYPLLQAEFVIVAAYMCLVERRQELDRLLSATLISILAIMPFSALIPAVGAGVYYGIEQESWVADIVSLRAHTGDIVRSSGPISFPSLHTISTLLLMDALRRDKLLFLPSLVFNGLMLLSIPTEGAHYFVDMLAGGIVAWAVLSIVDRFKAASRSPESGMNDMATSASRACERKIAVAD
jgi:membrane-associated phospholipid phosphatase